jgi:hypothetical protein
MFDAPVAGEIEHGFLAEPRRIEIAIVHQEFVLLGGRFGYDLTIRIDDHGVRHAAMAALDAAVWPKGDFRWMERSSCKAV